MYALNGKFILINFSIGRILKYARNSEKIAERLSSTESRTCLPPRALPTAVIDFFNKKISAAHVRAKIIIFVEASVVLRGNVE